MRELPAVFLDRILKSLTEFNSIQYVAYRTAAKLLKIQKELHVDKLPLDVLSGVLLKHQLSSTENAVRLTFPELRNLLHDVFFAIAQQQNNRLDIDQAVSLLCHFIFLVLQKENGVELLGIKVVLSLLSGSKPRDKYVYLFSELADHNSVLTPLRLELLLQRIVLLTEFVGEGQSFGKSLVPGTVKSCFEGLTDGSIGVSLEVFLDWLSRDPQLLVWISTVHRLHLADSVVHDVKCTVCKSTPMVGLRYRCLRCLTYNQCQNCFFTGKVSRSHKKKHPVQEYCYQSTPRQSIRALLVTLTNKIRRAGWRLQYLPAEQRHSYLQDATIQLDQLEESTKALCSSSEVSPKDLEMVIMELEEHSRRLLQFVEHVEAPNVRSFLCAHRSMMEKQVERLRVVKQQLLTCREVNSQPSAPWATNSTPFAHPQRAGAPTAGPVSPITNYSLALTWDQYDIVHSAENSTRGGKLPSVLSWEGEASSASSDSGVKTDDSEGYSWLKTTQGANGASVNEKQKSTPEDIKAMQDDLDQILDRLQQLLSNSDAKYEAAAKEIAPEDIWERL